MLRSNQKCSGTPIEDTVWIDPTPVVVATPAKDTICTGDATSILLTSVTTSTNGVEFNYTSIASDASIGGNGAGTLTPGQSITETLTNSDDTQGYVAYTITPWTLDAFEQPEVFRHIHRRYCMDRSYTNGCGHSCQRHDLHG